MHVPCQLGCRNALHSFTGQTQHPSCHGEAENHIPRSSTPNNNNPNLNSETDPGLRSATPMLTQRQQHTCTRRAAFKFSIGGRESIRQYVIVRGGRVCLWLDHKQTATLRDGVRASLCSVRLRGGFRSVRSLLAAPQILP